MITEKKSEPEEDIEVLLNFMTIDVKNIEIKKLEHYKQLITMKLMEPDFFSLECLEDATSYEDQDFPMFYRLLKKFFTSEELQRIIEFNKFPEILKEKIDKFSPSSYPGDTLALAWRSEIYEKIAELEGDVAMEAYMRFLKRLMTTNPIIVHRGFVPEAIHNFTIDEEESLYRSHKLFFHRKTKIGPEICKKLGIKGVRSGDIPELYFALIRKEMMQDIEIDPKKYEKIPDKNSI